MLHSEGELATIDLGKRRVTTTEIDGVLKTFVGGRGIGTKLAHDRIPFDADPLSPENRVYLSAGPLQMSNMSYTGRMNATTLSPLTDGLLSSNAGGFLSRNFADTGFSCVELVGESDEMMAIHVTDNGVTFETVPELKGATVEATSEFMEQHHGLDSEHLVTVGPAGENQVRYASLMTYDSRAFGRGGIGAVLGSKNVKTIAFSGDSRPEIDIPDVASKIHQEAAVRDHIMKRQGTTGGVDVKNDMFSLPTKYFARMDFDEGVQGINGDAVESKKYRSGTCSVCAFACKLPTRDDETGLETEGPEYETVFSFGSNLLVDDIVAVMKSNDLCDNLGLDTISTGVSIGAYLKATDRFGDSELIHELVKQIAHREGVGDMLAEGVDRIHDELDVENWSSKGLEFPGHDGRVLHGRALGYATANRGADHMYSKIHNLEYNGTIDPENLDGKVPLIIELQDLKALKDSGIVCRFAHNYLSDERYESLFGADYEELLTVGSRIVDLERHFNNRRGFDRENDALPYDIEGMSKAIDDYYAERNWTKMGIVPESKIEYDGIN